MVSVGRGEVRRGGATSGSTTAEPQSPKRHSTPTGCFQYHSAITIQRPSLLSPVATQMKRRGKRERKKLNREGSESVTGVPDGHRGGIGDEEDIGALLLAARIDLGIRSAGIAALAAIVDMYHAYTFCNK